MTRTLAAGLCLPLLLACSGREIPVVLQEDTKDDCAASMAMALAYHGQVATVAELRGRLNTSPEGTCNGLTMLNEARRRQLDAKGVLIESPNAIRRIPRASVIHWMEEPGPFPRKRNFPTGDPLRGRFVVLDKVGEDRVSFVDPTIGRREVSKAEFLQHFSGVVLLLEAI